MTQQLHKLQAVFLVLLLVGSQAVRVGEAARINSHLKHAGGKPEKTVAREAVVAVSRHCKWNLLRGGCSGEGCRFRPLPLDRTLTSSCRVSNSYMMKNKSPAHFAKVHAEFLEEKSTELKDHCSTEVSKTHHKHELQCLRKAGYVVQSSAFLAKAQRYFENSTTPELKEEMNARIEQAMVNIANVTGKDGGYLLKLRDKLLSNKQGFLEDPKGTLVDVTSSAFALMGGNEAMREQAKTAIDEMPVVHDDMEKLKKELPEVEARLNAMGDEYKSSDKDAWAQVDKMIPQEPEEEDAASSLMETKNWRAAKIVGICLAVAAAILLVVQIITSILFWLGNAILGLAGAGTIPFASTFVAIPLMVIGLSYAIYRGLQKNGLTSIGAIKEAANKQIKDAKESEQLDAEVVIDENENRCCNPGETAGPYSGCVDCMGGSIAPAGGGGSYRRGSGSYRGRGSYRGGGSKRGGGSYRGGSGRGWQKPGYNKW